MPQHILRPRRRLWSQLLLALLAAGSLPVCAMRMTPAALPMHATPQRLMVEVGAGLRRAGRRLAAETAVAPHRPAHIACRILPRCPSEFL